jgi:hypothetical protein
MPQRPLPGDWFTFYSFIIGHQLPFEYERPLCANTSRPATDEVSRRKVAFLGSFD